MTQVKIYGASDDLVEVSGIEGADEYATNGHWTGVLEAPNGDTAFVYVDYRDNGTWTVALGQYDEDYALPKWPAAFAVDGDKCLYSTTATIEVPDGTKITEVTA